MSIWQDRKRVGLKRLTTDCPQSLPEIFGKRLFRKSIPVGNSKTEGRDNRLLRQFARNFWKVNPWKVDIHGVSETFPKILRKLSGKVIAIHSFNAITEIDSEQLNSLHQ